MISVDIANAVEGLRSEWEVRVIILGWGWRFCISTMYKCFTYLVRALIFRTQKFYIYLMHILVILKCQRSLVFIAVITWCNCQTGATYTHYVIYTNGSTVVKKLDFSIFVHDLTSPENTTFYGNSVMFLLVIVITL